MIDLPTDLLINEKINDTPGEMYWYLAKILTPENMSRKLFSKFTLTRYNNIYCRHLDVQCIIQDHPDVYMRAVRNNFTTISHARVFDDIEFNPDRDDMYRNHYVLGYQNIKPKLLELIGTSLLE